MTDPRYMITTPIYYVNGSPHIGHAYTSVAADVIARWKRLDGFDVFFLTGTDEHGQKVERAAADRGVTTTAFVDTVASEFQAMAASLAISHDDFIRTTSERHVRACQALWRRIAAHGDIYLGAYEGWYALRDEAFYGADEIEDGPNGQKRAVATGAPVSWVTEPSYFFRLSDWGPRLLAFYEAHPDFIAPLGSRNEILSFVRGGLHDLSISRTSFSWGVPVPDDPGHVMYVWFDALTNYLSALGWPDGEAAARWPADLHLVGKEIARFHAVYWPAFLMAADLPVPLRVFANGWLTVEGAKMSKSLGNAIAPDALIAEFGLDPLRFYLLREVPFGRDGAFSRQSLVARLNGELANELGNLAQRTLTQVARNLGGILPPIPDRPTDEDRALLESAIALPARLHPLIDRQALGDALEEVWTVVRASNAYIDRQAPWVLRKTDPARMAVVLRVLTDVVRGIATVLVAFMPASMARLLDQLGVPDGERDLASLVTPLAGGVTLPAPFPLFPRLEPDRLVQNG